VIPLAGSVAAVQAPLKVAMPVAKAAPSTKATSRELLKLRKAAGEFESILLESLWKSMKETFFDPEDGDSDPTLKCFDDWGIQAMAIAVGDSGGLGIKILILKHLEPTLPGGGQATASGR
jgi:Rod binding domain-containing protein